MAAVQNWWLGSNVLLPPGGGGGGDPEEGEGWGGPFAVYMDLLNGGGALWAHTPDINPSGGMYNWNGNLSGSSYVNLANPEASIVQFTCNDITGFENWVWEINFEVNASGQGIFGQLEVKAAGMLVTPVYYELDGTTLVLYVDGNLIGNVAFALTPNVRTKLTIQTIGSQIVIGRDGGPNLTPGWVWPGGVALADTIQEFTVGRIFAHARIHAMQFLFLPPF